MVDGFIGGPIRNAANNVVLNDGIAVLSSDEYTQALEKRVANEVLACLEGYASANTGHYPFTAKSDDTGNLAEQSAMDPNPRFGRVPTTVSWPAGCIVMGPWWPSWQTEVFFAIGADYAAGGPGPLNCGVCLVVQPAITNKRVVVLVAGRALAGQIRSSPTAPAIQYLEGANSNGDATYETGTLSPIFNDVVVSR